MKMNLFKRNKVKMKLKIKQIKMNKKKIRKKNKIK